MDLAYRLRISQLLHEPNLLGNVIIRKLMMSSREIVTKNYDRESPVLSGLLKSKIHASNVWQTSSDFFYTVTTIATSNGFRYPMAVAGGTLAFRGAGFDTPAPVNSGRIKSGQDFKGSGGIRPNMFAKRAMIASQFPVYKHIFVGLKNHIETMIEYNNG